MLVAGPSLRSLRVRFSRVCCSVLRVLTILVTWAWVLVGSPSFGSYSQGPPCRWCDLRDPRHGACKVHRTFCCKSYTFFEASFSWIVQRRLSIWVDVVQVMCCHMYLGSMATEVSDWHKQSTSIHSSSSEFSFGVRGINYGEQVVHSKHPHLKFPHGKVLTMEFLNIQWSFRRRCHITWHLVCRLAILLHLPLPPYLQYMTRRVWAILKA